MPRLGLDINTNRTGFCVLGRGRLLQRGSIDTRDLAAPLHIAGRIAGRLKEVKEAHPGAVWQVGIEQYLRGFSGAKFQTKHLFRLAEINAMVQASTWRIFGTEPMLLHPTYARTQLGIITTKGTTKQDVLEFVARDIRKHDASFVWDLNRRRNVAQHCFDEADAYVIAACLPECEE